MKVSCISNVNNLEKGILIDSGCTTHLFREESSFTNWDTQVDIGEIKLVLANGSIASDVIKGKGTVCITARASDGTETTITLHDCLYYPECSFFGIISLDQAVSQNIDKAIFEKEGSYLRTLDGIEIPLRRSGNLHFLNAAKSEKFNLELHKSGIKYCVILTIGIY